MTGSPMYPGFQQAQQFAPPPPGVVYAQQYAQPQQQQPQFQQQPIYQQPMQGQMPQQFQGADLNQRLPNDPSLPQELRGKTVGEAVRYYGIMREDFVRRQDQQQQQQQPPRQQQQFQQQQPQRQMGWPAPQARQSAQPNFGQQQQQQEVDPVRATIDEALSEALPRYLAPIVQPMQQQQLLSTYNTIKSRYPDWPQFESEVISSMQGADPSALQNPAAWEAAYFHAKGKAVSQRQIGPGQQQNMGQQFQPNQQGWQNGQPQQQAVQQFYQQPQQGYNGPAGNQFVEGPTPSANGMNQPQQDPRDEMFARRFNMPLEVYRSWKAGRVGLMQTPQPQQQFQQNGQQMQQPQFQGGQQQQQFQGGMPQNFNGFQQQAPQGYYQPQQMNGGNYAP